MLTDSNQEPQPAQEDAYALLRRYLDKEGRLTVLPSKQPIREEAMRYLAQFFSTDVRYTEKEVNAILTEHHTFGDFFMLRRELINRKLLFRERDGSAYWKEAVEAESL